MIMVGVIVAHSNAIAQKPRLNPSHVMGAEACSECHGDEVDAWRKTNHFSTFKTLARKPKAREIAKALGVKDLTSDSLCIECHFTLQKKGARTRAIAGISCESCHGAATKWIKEHNKESVSRAARVAASEKAGMIYPENLYAVARNCYDCHIVSSEKLVNTGGHPPFSKDFDLAAWSQGEVLHSFMTDASPVKKAGKTNRPASANRKRMLYMVGKILSLEYSLRAVGNATTASAKPPGGGKAYGVAHAIRASGLIKEIEKLNVAMPTDEVTGIIAAAKSAKLKTKNAGPLTAAADKISVLAKKFASMHDGAKFAVA